MSSEFEDGFDFGEENEFDGTPYNGTENSGNTVAPESNPEVSKKVEHPKKRLRGKMVKTSNAIPDPNKTVTPPQRKKEKGVSKKDTPKEEKESQVKKDVVKEKHEKPQKQKRPKSKKAKRLLVGLAVVAVVACGGIVVKTVLLPTPMEYDYNTSGRALYDNLQSKINNYDAKEIDTLFGSSNGDSYIAQEWSYANNNEVREKYIKYVTSIVKFTYPQVEQLSTKGKVMKDKSGNPIMVESYMNNGEKVIVTVPDYQKIADSIKDDSDNIIELGISKNIKDTDFDYQDKCFDLMLEYIMGIDELPTTQVEVSIPIAGGGIFSDDSELDNALFASKEFHNLCDEFDKVMTGFTGVKEEKYMDKEEVPNPEYDEWYKIFKERYDADGGVFDKYTSQWEPWYVYNDKNELQRDADGNPLVRYYSVKDKNGNDWIQPSKTILKDVEKTREVPAEYMPEQAVPYCFLGSWYIQNKYSGDVPSDIRVGDGTLKHPAGVGTPIITKVKGSDGKYHDIKVTLKGYWVGQDAIDYAVSFSEKNRGFDADSPVQLICYEVQVDNLENKDLTFDSEMMLCDKSASRTGRTGTMYGFNYEGVTVKANDSIIYNDWATSTEIEQKYVAWGKSFNREVEPVFFKVLAGTGKVPSYSAYKEFTGKSNLDEDGGMPVVNETGTDGEIDSTTSDEQVKDSEEIQEVEK